MVGLFINTLPLRLKLSPGAAASELLRQTQESQSALMAHQHSGLARSSRRPGSASCSTRSWCSRTIRSTATALRRRRDGLRLGRVEGRDATHYPLTLMVQPGAELQLRLDYRPDLFDRGERGGDRRAADAAAGGGGRATPARPIGSLPILAAAERDTILRVWNARTGAQVPIARARRRRGPRSCLRATLPALFAAQARARRMRSRWCSRTGG